jgi:phosphonate transport system substrate-binding protein
VGASLACFGGLAVLTGCGPRTDAGKGTPAEKAAEGHTRDTFTLTIVPYEAADKLNEEYSPMATYLAKKLGKKSGKFFFVTDYSGVLAALQSGQVDVAYLSPLPYAIASGKMKLTPLAMPYVRGSLSYYGIVFVKADSPIKTLQDLKGHTFAFGDRTSTTGYLLPRHLLETNGVPLDALKRYYNAGDANMVVKAIETGTADAGAAYNLVFDVAYKGQPEKAKQMRVLAKTEEIPNGLYVARGDMPAAEVEKLKAAFMEMNTDPEGKAAMLKAPNDKVVPADDKLFDGVRATAKAADIDIQTMDNKKK